MKKVLIVGAGQGGIALLKLFQSIKSMEIIAVIDSNIEAPGLELAKRYHINTDSNWEAWLDEVDIIIEVTGVKEVLQKLIEKSPRNAVIIPGSVAYIISELFKEKEFLVDQLKLLNNKQELILSHIRDGMIVIDKEGTIQFLNKSAENIIGISKEEAIGNNIVSFIRNSRLLDVLETKDKEINQPFQLENGKKIITTRIPIIDSEEKLIGAIAVFKDITEVRKLAEENTELNDFKTMLEAIFKSSDEAISVVDEKGNGLMINPAYTKITGLSEREVIGKPATTDISEGESMHLKVLKTKKSYRGVRMKVGPKRKEVLVNVAPVIVNGEVKGSVGVLHDVSEIRSLTKELNRARRLIRNLEAKYTFDDIIGNSSLMQLALEQAKVGAKTPATVLLRGKSGTGKELFAHAIHNESDRKHNKFIRVNCAAIAESILESELFGYVDGAFSGAKHGGKKGLFQEANHGSIFLDEIGELSSGMQAKLLRVLQEGEIIPVGGTKPVQVNVRVIAATNINLEKAVVNNTFREDLYYRLNRLPIYIPSLKERLTDLPDLVNHMIQKLNEDYGRNVQGLEQEALSILQQYHWPGNIRELENIIGRTMIYMDMNDKVIRKEHIPELADINSSNSKQDLSEVIKLKPLQEAIDQFEKEYIQKIYRSNQYNKTMTAKELNISIRNLYYKIKKYQLD